MGLGAAVEKIQSGVPDLADAGGEHALAHPGVVLGEILIRRGGDKTHLVQTLAGIAGGVDVGDVVARHIQALLGGIDAQTGGAETAECTAHADPPYALKSAPIPLRGELEGV